MKFQSPEYLFLLLLLLPIIYWYIKQIKKSDASLQISSHQNLVLLKPGRKVKLRHIPFILRLLSIAFIIVAIARPQAANSWRTQNTEGIDIMIAMDISGTMMGEDLKPNRIEASKSVASEFILSRPSDNIGLVLFSGESFCQCPLTTDHAVLINLLKSVKFGMIEDGTAIGLGLANAVNRIKEGKSKSKAIILLTDGSNNRGDIAPITAADIAKTFGIRVYTIGVGSYGMVNIPYGTQYIQMESEFDENSLKNIAATTGGKYFRATDTQKLRKIYQEIDHLEKTRTRIKEYSKREEEFYLFALLALIFAGTEIVLRNTYFRKLP